MKIPVELFIAVRYLRARKNGFFSLIATFIAVGGTTLGTAALIITLAVMTGFQTDIKNKILGVQPHIIITRIDGYAFNDFENIKQQALQNKHVKGISPFIYRQAIIRNLENTATTGLVIKAIDYEFEDKMINLTDILVDKDENFDGKLGSREIILGSELAANIGAFAGGEAALMFPADINSMPRMFKFKIKAILHSGMYDVDSSFAFIDLGEAQGLFSMEGRVTGLGIHTDNVNRAVQTASEIQKNLPSSSYLVRAWIELNKNLFSALKLEKIMMFLILGLIILVAAFNIISNVLLLSVQKFKEIGIMSAMGFTRLGIAKIFFYEGLIVGALGAVLGIILGLSISFALQYFDVFKLPSGIYYVERLPIAVAPLDVFLVSLCSFIVSALAGIYPAYQVSKLNPVEAIKG